MGLISELQKTQAKHVAVGVSLFLATVAPGMLTIFMYQRALFQELDTVPLLTFAAALGLPVLVANYLCVVVGFMIAGDEVPEDDSENASVWMLAMLTSFAVFYGALLASFGDRAVFRTFLWRLGYFQALMFLLSCGFGFGERRNRNRITSATPERAGGHQTQPNKRVEPSA